MTATPAAVTTSVGDRPAPSLGALLAAPPTDRLQTRPDLHGFGGLHGGFALARLTASMRAHATTGEVRSVTARFHRTLRDDATVDTAVVHSGRSTTTVAARAATDAGPAVDAVALFGAPRRNPWTAVAPVAPEAPPPDDLGVFAVPTELVPIAAHIEVRPVSAALPYTGGTDPELVAWLRLLGDDAPPDLHRLLVLADALAPSYAAVMSAPDPVPTVELTVRPSPGLAGAHSPWVLVRATTRAAHDDGWVDEVIDVWGADGTHLAGAHQLRVVTSAS
ncbi:acyl-CoA thioesterase domain-containing protein [Actinomarinicola tropica]|uniref:Thioesterase family protein n=1 Tax=Actinomarinicola tropica TaxID=2789776 RepID=A0A5Q2RHJ2_9ACTN|nr:acyl-CoA thioesterase domain-containing protein [Actinomarinicola tropica]QGG94342.1 thioesterase family protein [Actinomarinicola tropica]